MILLFTCQCINNNNAILCTDDTLRGAIKYLLLTYKYCLYCVYNVQYIQHIIPENEGAILLSPQTNALYHAAFEEWASQFTNVKILSDQTRSNDVNTLHHWQVLALTK